MLVVADDTRMSPSWVKLVLITVIAEIFGYFPADQVISENNIFYS